MKCPACKDMLVGIELDGVEVDWCGACKGVWLDKAELELLHTDGQAAARFVQELKAAPHSVREKAKRCPICNIRMKRVQSAWDSGIVLDQCPRGDGIWFDKGELFRMLGTAGKSDKVKSFLTGIFGSDEK